MATSMVMMTLQWKRWSGQDGGSQQPPQGQAAARRRAPVSAPFLSAFLMPPARGRLTSIQGANCKREDKNSKASPQGEAHLDRIQVASGTFSATYSPPSHGSPAGKRYPPELPLQQHAMECSLECKLPWARGWKTEAGKEQGDREPFLRHSEWLSREQGLSSLSTQRGLWTQKLKMQQERLQLDRTEACGTGEILKWFTE